MAAPAIAAGALHDRLRLAPTALTALLATLGGLLVLLIGVLGALFGLQGLQGGLRPISDGPRGDPGGVPPAVRGGRRTLRR